MEDLTSRQRDSKLKKLDGENARATAELRELRRREALKQIEAEFAPEAA